MSNFVCPSDQIPPKEPKLRTDFTIFVKSRRKHYLALGFAVVIVYCETHHIAWIGGGGGNFQVWDPLVRMVLFGGPRGWPQTHRCPCIVSNATY